MYKEWIKENIPLGHHSEDCCKQDSRMNTQINEWNFKEKQDICLALK